MKKYLKFLPLFLLLVCGGWGNNISYAQDDLPPLQVECGTYNNEIITFIEQNWMNFFGKEELKDYAKSGIIIGEPYGVYSVDEEKMIATKFPIYVDGKCVRVLDVFQDKDGNFTWSATIDSDFMSEIEQLCQQTGIYRIETTSNLSGGAPVMEFVSLAAKNPGIQYFDISQTLLSISPQAIQDYVDGGSIEIIKPIPAPVEEKAPKLLTLIKVGVTCLALILGTYAEKMFTNDIKIWKFICCITGIITVVSILF